jgi:hypothetical protein
MILTIKTNIIYIELCFSSIYGDITKFKIKKSDFYKKYSKYNYKNLENYIYSKQFESKIYDRIADFMSSVYCTGKIMEVN